MSSIKITIQGDKVTLIKALEALQHAKIEATAVQVGNATPKVKKQDEKPYRLAEAFEEGDQNGQGVQDEIISNL